MYRQIVAMTALGLASFTAMAQNNISGKIITSDGQAAALVNIELKENKKNQVSNEEGNFDIKNVPDGKYTLVVSFIGLQTQQKTIVLNNSISTIVNFVLIEDAQQLREVIISSKKGMSGPKELVNPSKVVSEL